MIRRYKVFLNQRNTILNKGVLRSNNSIEGFKFKYFEGISRNHFIQTTIQEYPATKQLPLPLNMKNLASFDKMNFSYKRNREINGSFISSSASSESVNKNITDDRIECYDCFGAINLSSSMQTNVPFPFVSGGKPTHLNMPGGLWGQREKYMSEELNKLHHINLRFFSSKIGDVCTHGTKTSNNTYLCFFEKRNVFSNYNIDKQLTKNISTSAVKKLPEEINEKQKESKKTSLSLKEKLKVAIIEYGSLVLVFHISISLINLGIIYMVVKSGADVSKVIEYFGIEEGAASAGTAAYFIVAYAIHKATAPIRITLTLTAVPFIVKKLRKLGFFKSLRPKV